MTTDIVTRLEKWFDGTTIPQEDKLLQLQADLREAIGTIKQLRNDDPWLDASYYTQTHEFRIWVEPIEREFWDDETKVMVMRKAYAIRARPLSASGFFAYAYKNSSDAALVAGRMADRFDVQTYRVNFSADGNPVGYREKLKGS